MTEQPRYSDASAGSGRPVAGGPWSPGSPAAPHRSARRTIASFGRYEDAERAVDRLSDLGFPVERVAIIGQDLQTVEQVTGKMDYPRAAWRGALSGAVPGALIGWIFGLFNWVNPLITAVLLALYGAIIGAVIGAIIGVIIYALQRGRRDFASVTVMRPQGYEVVVDDEVADEAARLLGTGV
ncbi:MAG TPA: general stress protein [Pseudonocardia sp.]|nr:general stress protein [Pseudonocardia sp.]